MAGYWVVTPPGLLQEGGGVSQGKSWQAPGQTPNISQCLSKPTLVGAGAAGWLVRNLELLELLLGNVLRTAARAELEIWGAKLAEQKQLQPQHVVLA